MELTAGPCIVRCRWGSAYCEVLWRTAGYPSICPAGMPMLLEGCPWLDRPLRDSMCLHELVGGVPLAVGVEGKGPALGSHNRTGGNAVAARSMHICAGGALRARAGRMHGGLLGQQLPGICGRLRALAPRRWHLGHLLHDRLPVLLIGLPSMPILGLLLLLLLGA